MDQTRGTEVIVRELLMPKLVRDARGAHGRRGRRRLARRASADRFGAAGRRAREPAVGVDRARADAVLLGDGLARGTAGAGAPGTRAGSGRGPRAASSMFAKRMTKAWFEPVSRLRAELGLPRAGHPMFEGMFSPLAHARALLARARRAAARLAAARAYDRLRVLQRPGRGSFAGARSSSWPPGRRRSCSRSARRPSALPAASITRARAAVARLGVRAVLLIGTFEQNRPDASCRATCSSSTARRTSSCFLARARS